ncbi:hypothetical protein PBCV1_A366L [Paramecium bursaria Chlorella virus 1]|uniref:Uncharacterized protein n=1 Tax=Paramecium bursaria Chlorella virus 1 TaxID=10506 RepID=Q98418_PBCV1|nr:hypothetical protein PBCV1_A366L [Paramecium bursaria Chlorella virus 1]AAC96734.1 hypothetical protein [Paramecium bursaria Chlorella virus 1]
MVNMDIDNDKIIIVKLYVCDKCGYKTQTSSHASRHSKNKSCEGCVMKTTSVPTIPVDYMVELLSKSSVVNGVSTSIGTNYGNVMVSNVTVNNINVYIPENTLKEDMIEFLKTLTLTDTPTAHQMIKMPSRLLYNARNPEKHPGAITERGDKIVEKLPGGGERVMGRKKAIKLYTYEAVDALCKNPPTQGVKDYFEKERTIGKKEIAIKDAVSANAKNSVEFHHKIPTELKKIVGKFEEHTETELNNITKENHFLF